MTVVLYEKICIIKRDRHLVGGRNPCFDLLLCGLDLHGLNGTLQSQFCQGILYLFGYLCSGVVEKRKRGGEPNATGILEAHGEPVVHPKYAGRIGTTDQTRVGTGKEWRVVGG